MTYSQRQVNGCLQHSTHLLHGQGPRPARCLDIQGIVPVEQTQQVLIRELHGDGRTTMCHQTRETEIRVGL